MVQEHRGEYPSLRAAIESNVPKICCPCTVEQDINLPPQLGLGTDHALAARGFELGSIYHHGAQFDQAALACQVHYLHKQVRRFLQMLHTEAGQPGSFKPRGIREDPKLFPIMPACLRSLVMFGLCIPPPTPKTRLRFRQPPFKAGFFNPSRPWGAMFFSRLPSIATQPAFALASRA